MKRKHLGAQRKRPRGAPFSLGPQPSRHVSSAQLYPKFIEFRAMSVVHLKLKAGSLVSHPVFGCN